jgi:hypothetical protein
MRCHERRYDDARTVNYVQVKFEHRSQFSVNGHEERCQRREWLKDTPRGDHPVPRDDVNSDTLAALEHHFAAAGKASGLSPLPSGDGGVCACRNNRSRAVSRRLSRVEPSGGVLVTYAARDGTTADDGDSGHSPFTQPLLPIWTGLEINLPFRRVRNHVLARTNKWTGAIHLWLVAGGGVLFQADGRALTDVHVDQSCRASRAVRPG